MGKGRGTVRFNCIIATYVKLFRGRGVLHTKSFLVKLLDKVVKWVKNTQKYFHVVYGSPQSKARKKQKKIGKKAGYPEKACTASCNNICSN